MKTYLNIEKRGHSDVVLFIITNKEHFDVKIVLQSLKYKHENYGLHNLIFMALRALRMTK